MVNTPTLKRTNSLTPIETVGVGDEITAYWQDGSLSRTARGVVSHIERYGRVRVLMCNTQEICRYTLGEKRVRAIMHHKYVPDMQPELFTIGKQ